MLHLVVECTALKTRRGISAALFVFLVTLGLGWSGTAVAVGEEKRSEGDVLRMFDKGRVYVVTNDEADLADILLEDANHKERRILTPQEWQEMPKDVRRYVSVVFLVNREYLPINVCLPEKCPAERDELVLKASRLGSNNGVTYEVIISAPDAAWLRQGIRDFRKLTEPPRNEVKRNVRSLAIVPVGRGAIRAAEPMLQTGDDSAVRGHLLPALNYPRVSERLSHMDEVFLIDRSAVQDPAFSQTIRQNCEGLKCGPNDTVWWKERKPSGRSRYYISAPLADHLVETVRRNPGLTDAPETPTVVYTARDLRAVRRVAVVAVKQGAEDDEMSRRIASKAATGLRSLEAFEVLERAGLSEMLGEIALGQAGITKAADRSRVRQLAAADALMLVEVTGVSPHTDYSARHRRLTSRMGNPPKRPSQPSRLRIPISIRGKENDPVVRVITDVLFGGAVGNKNDREYREAINQYNNETLPRWQREMEQYEYDKQNRPVQWEESITARTTVTISGSLRLVDLSDGLVLWETVFVANEKDERPYGVRTIQTQGEDSVPSQQNLQVPDGQTPQELVVKAADTAVENGIQILRGTTILPTNAVLSPSAETDTAKPTAIVGRILDVDGDLVLVGLGAAEGLKVNDTLTITLEDGETVALTVAKVRPRTCDATFAPAVTPGQRARVVAGGKVTKEMTP